MGDTATMLDASKKAKPIKFTCYRYAVIPNGQIGLWQDVEFSKRHVVDELIRYCSDTAPYPSSFNGVESVLFYTRPIGETAHLLKFCRKQRLRRFEIETDLSDVIPRVLDTYPFVYVIVDTGQQTVMVQKKSTVFKSAGGAKASLTAMVKQFLSDDNYYFSLDEITASSSFWETIESADEVYDVTLKLQSPNFLGSGYATTELLNRIRKVTNNDYVDITLSNSSGELEMPRDEYGDTIDYVTAGGGSWSTTVASGGSKRVTHKSDDFAKVIEVRVSEDAPLDDSEIIVAIRGVGQRKGTINESVDVGSQ